MAEAVCPELNTFGDTIVIRDTSERHYFLVQNSELQLLMNIASVYCL